VRQSICLEGLLAGKAEAKMRQRTTRHRFLVERPEVSGGFTTFEVGDPRETCLVARERLPPNQRFRLNEREVWSRTYEAADWSRFKIGTAELPCDYFRGLGRKPSPLSYCRRAGTSLTIHDRAIAAYCISVIERGLVAGQDRRRTRVQRSEPFRTALPADLRRISIRGVPRPKRE
jgi:hypothetical protein